MHTEAVFDDIAKRIQLEINGAQLSIIIAVAWFTNKELFNKILEKAKEGCKVSLIISSDVINVQSKIKYDELVEYNSKCYMLGDNETAFMHNKFCVIDYNTVITGSYNWSYKAESNFENVVITYDDTALAEQFIDEFNQILCRFYPHEPKIEIAFPVEKIIKRLEILKNHIILEDIEGINEATNKLKEYEYNTEIFEITDSIQKKEFATAICKIQNFINHKQLLLKWDDPEISALRFEIKILENKLNSFENEKIELEKVLSDFQYRHTVELGRIILEILNLRKIKYRNITEKNKEVEEDFNQYNEQFKEEKSKLQWELTDEAKDDLKRKFRKASFLCHPDKVDEKNKKEAQRIFVELTEAYQTNDLKKVTEILNYLEIGNFFKSKSDTISEKGKLLSALNILRTRIKALENNIIAIKESEAYKTIKNIDNWDAYFKKTKSLLEQELHELKIEIDNG